MAERALAVLGLAFALFALGCDRGPVSVESATLTAPDRTVPDSAAPVAATVVRADDRRIAGPSAAGTSVGLEASADPLLTLFEPVPAGAVTLSPVVPGATRKGSPSIDLFGGADQPWRVQVGPRMDLGRKSGLMLRGGTEGQHNRWDLGASATVGDQSNVQGIVRFHP